MEKIVILNANNEKMNVEVVRYFSEGTNKYFVFTLNEKDGQGHMNIYVTKIVEQDGRMIGANIIDDVEWTNLKTTLQRIIKENRSNGNAIVNDMPCNSLVNVRVADRRALKLLEASVGMLNMGYKVVEPTVEPSVSTVTETPSQNVQPTIEQPVFNNPFEQPVSNQPVNNVSVEPESKPIEQPTPMQGATDYQSLYMQEKAKNDKLMQEYNRLKDELVNCNNKLSSIKDILS